MHLGAKNARTFWFADGIRNLFLAGPVRDSQMLPCFKCSNNP